MTIKKKSLRLTVYCLFITAYTSAQHQSVSLQMLLNGMLSNNDLLKYYRSLVESKQAEIKLVAYDRLPHLNTMYQLTIGSANNVQGSYLTMGVIPSITGGSRAYSITTSVSGNTILGGVDWEVVNFGGYKARRDVAKSELTVETNLLAKTNYDLIGTVAAYYLELLHQYELKTIAQDNVARLQILLTSINSLISNGIRPGVDSSIASSELSKSKVTLYEAQKNLEQLQVQLSTLSGISASLLSPDTNIEVKLINTGVAIMSAQIDTAHHPAINLYTSVYDLNRVKLQLERKRFYPKIILDADMWTRGSSLSSADKYNSDLLVGYIPNRLNYFVGLTMNYDILSIVRKKLSMAVSKFEAEASEHRLQQEKDNINNELQRALIENSYQLSRLRETEHQVQFAATAYEQQENLYKNGLSSVIDLNIALNYFIQARRDHIDTKIGYVRSVLNYSLIANSFNSMLKTLKL